MPEIYYNYIIIGGGLAGVSGAEGIREIDKSGTILILNSEQEPPYQKPPLTKGLWTAKKKLSDVWIHDSDYYSNHGIDLWHAHMASSIDTHEKRISTFGGDSIQYGKLLLATGGKPNPLSIPGGDLKEIFYYRSLNDFQKLKEETLNKRTVTIIGGGFIGSELAASLSEVGLEVTLIFPGKYLSEKLFSPSLGNSIQNKYKAKGVRIVNGDKPAFIDMKGPLLNVTTERGFKCSSDLLVIGAGIAPSTELAEKASLKTGNGIWVDDFLRTSDPDIYSAGDVANFTLSPFGKRARLEHWDNALSQGKWAGRNMTGAVLKYDYMPYFFSDLYDFGYEAIGEINSSLETFADWEVENERGIVYYLEKEVICGILLCNVWGKINDARNLLSLRKKMVPKELKSAISMKT